MEQNLKVDIKLPNQNVFVSISPSCSLTDLLNNKDKFLETLGKFLDYKDKSLKEEQEIQMLIVKLSEKFRLDYLLTLSKEELTKLNNLLK